MKHFFQTTLLILLLGWVASFTRTGQAKDVPAPRPAVHSTPATPKPADERLLVLYNGKVVKGKIHQSATGYVVVVPTGKMVLPFEQVLLEADDLQDAYDQQRGALPENNAAAHIELARWCLTNGLHDQARAELRETLLIEPTSTVAKNMLQRITDLQLTTSDLPRIGVRDGRYSLLGDAKPLPTVDPLGGLPREVAAEFVSKVQPLLVNRCAMAGCHSPGSGNGLELQRVRLGKSSPKSYSQRNLAAVLERLDLQQPANSTLLTKLRGENSLDGVVVTHGGLSREQLQLLQTWIKSVARKPSETSSEGDEKPESTDEAPDSQTEPASKPPESVATEIEVKNKNFDTPPRKSDAASPVTSRKPATKSLRGQARAE